MSKWKTILKVGLIVPLVIYMIGALGLYIKQDDIIFRPTKLPDNQIFNFGEQVEIEVEEDLYLHGLFNRSQNSNGVVLYLHGNRGNTRWCQGQASMFAGLGYDVLLLDYRSYGKSDGHIEDAKTMYNDVQMVYDYLKESYAEEDIIIAGYSLGTGFATYLAANNVPKHLLLVAPFVSMIDMKNSYFPIVPDFLIKYTLNNKKHLSTVSCPVTIFHGTDDEVVPFESSKKLKALYPSKINMIILKGATHRRSIFRDEIREVLVQLMSR